jgi:hypothetical protein
MTSLTIAIVIAVALVLLILLIVRALRRARRKAINGLAAQIFILTKVAEHACEYAAADLTVADETTQAAYAAAAEELAGAGCELLGDHIEINVFRPEAGNTAQRWFLGDGGAILGWYALFIPQAPPDETLSGPLEILVLYSEVRGAGYVMTKRAPDIPSVVSAPELRSETLLPSASIEEVLASHRTALAELAGRRLIDANATWRRSKGDEIVELDLRSVLGDQYDVLGEELLLSLKQLRKKFEVA